MSKRDPIDQLTIAELDQGSRMLRTDLVGAISDGTMDRWQALAIVAWLTARRGDPQAKVEQYRQMTARELSAYLGLDDEGDPVDVDAIASTAGVDVDTATSVLVAAGVLDDGVANTADDNQLATTSTTGDAAPADTTTTTDVAADPTESAPAS